MADGAVEARFYTPRRKDGDVESVQMKVFDSSGNQIDLLQNGSGGASVIVQETEPDNVAVNSLWVEIDSADPPNVVAIHVAVA